MAGEGDEELTHEQTPNSKQKYEITEIYPFMQYKVYQLHEKDPKDIDAFCSERSVDKAVISNLNHEDPVLQTGKQILVPAYLHGPGKSFDLTVACLEKFKMEQRLMHDPYLPIFFMYYATVQGDILGQIMMTDCEIIFTPVHDKFKGTFNYEHGNLAENMTAGFTLSFADVVGLPKKQCLPADEKDLDNHEQTFDIQVGIKQSGY